MTDINKITPLKVYGSEISYFTGKLEMYLRYKEIRYQRIAITPLLQIRAIRATGLMQMPTVLLADGRWMTDSTPIIDWFEKSFPDTMVTPLDPQQGFFCRLLEDFADEWLWRPAMHYRWYYTRDAAHLSRTIVDEIFDSVPLPGFVKRLFIRWRQRRIYTRGDSIRSAATVAGVETIYLRILQQLEAIFQKRPFLLGDRPCLADIGFTGSMFRHFGLDPTASSIMREQAPAVFEWLGRLWNARYSITDGEWMADIPDYWDPFLDEIGNAYLPYLNANAEAFHRGDKTFSVTIDNVHYERARMAPYRVWCLEQLRDKFNRLPDTSKPQVKERLQQHGCWQPLWQIATRNSGVDVDKRLPFGPGSSMLGIKAWE